MNPDPISINPYLHQPNGGQRAALQPFPDYGPPDQRASQQNPYYTGYSMTRGRVLAGLGANAMPNADIDIQDYANELDMLAQEDDVVGNGVFDPPGSPPSNYADQTIFADHISMPGYIVRDQFYEPSEVTDITTGAPVMYVPSGAVALDQGQRDAFFETLMWQVPPEMTPYGVNEAVETSIVTPKEAEWPISGLGQDPDHSSGTKIFIMAGLAGLAVGLTAALLWPKKGS